MFTTNISSQNSAANVCWFYENYSFLIDDIKVLESGQIPVHNFFIVNDSI